MIQNAKISCTSLGTEDHGIMTCHLMLEGDGWCCGFGGYALDTFDKTVNMRVGTAVGLDAIMRLMETLEVEKWEDLKGQFIRCESNGWGGKITKIGHLIKEKWFSFEEYFNSKKGG